MIQRTTFRQVIAERMLVADSPWGAIVESRRDSAAASAEDRATTSGEGLPETLVLEDEAALAAIHRESLQAGADLLLTNTFAANAVALEPAGLADRTAEIVRRSVTAARQAIEAQGRRNDGTPWVGAVLGPLPAGVEPRGTLPFAKAAAIYREAAAAAVAADADLFVLDAIGELRNLRAALVALRDVQSDMPVIVLPAMQADGRLEGGTPPAVVWAVARSLGAEMVGASGGLSPAELLPAQAAYETVSDLPLGFLPAALPLSHPRRDPIGRAEFNRQLGLLAPRGIALLGCSGIRRSEHLDAVVRIARRTPPQIAERAQRLIVAGRKSDLEIGPRRGIATAADWPLRRGESLRAHHEGNLGSLLKGLERAVAPGIQMLEVRSTLPQSEEAAFLRAMIGPLDQRPGLPLLITADTRAGLTAALEATAGRPLISSVWADRVAFERIFPLARRHGAAVVATCHTGKRIPKDAAERIANAEAILTAALEAGLSQEDLIFDPVILPAADGIAQVQEALQALAGIRESLGPATMLRISRVSETLPGRGQLEAALLCMAAAAGLDLAVIDAAKPRLVNLAAAAAVLVGRDRGARHFKERFGEETPPSGPPRRRDAGSGRPPRRSESGSRPPRRSEPGSRPPRRATPSREGDRDRRSPRRGSPPRAGSARPGHPRGSRPAGPPRTARSRSSSAPKRGASRRP
jgi:5-methyltetrahydrofolate--homocysteine methyltransferase